MYEPLQKKQNKGKALASRIIQKKNNARQGFELMDNRPKNIVQRKIQEMTNSYPTKNLVMQKTKWIYDGSQWNVTSSSTSDTDLFSHPSIAHPSAKKDDQYDQQTGAYNSPLSNELSSLVSSSGSMGFYDRRSMTGFRYASGHNRQGPHTLAHITKRVAMAAAENIGRDPLKLIGSRAFPRPRVMNKKLRDRLKSRGPNWKKNTRTMRTKYLKNYKKNGVKVIYSQQKNAN